MQILIAFAEGGEREKELGGNRGRNLQGTICMEKTNRVSCKRRTNFSLFGREKGALGYLS